MAEGGVGTELGTIPKADGGPTRSWASILGRNLAPSMNKNVLEVVLEKETKGSFIVSDKDCANLIRRLGLDNRPGVHIEGVQICPNGRGTIYITLRKEVEIGKFCRYDVLDVTESGVRAVLVKPAGRREVVVTIRGIHPNTREDTVMEYLAKFGKLVSNKVIYGMFPEGPLQGMMNGDRSYKVEIKPGTNMGSYHVLDGQKVTLRYPGQQQTCARCLQTAQTCKGKGLARRCEAEGSQKRDFAEYISELWGKIGYSPSNNVTENLDSLPEQPTQQNGGLFTPAKLPSATEKFSGVCIKQLPKETDHGDVMEFLVRSGLPEEKKESVTISNNGTVIIRDLENKECLDLIEAIHGKKNFSKKLFCNGIVPLTPQKPDVQLDNSTGNAGDTPISPESNLNSEPGSTTNNAGKLLPPKANSAKPLPLGDQPVIPEQAPELAVNAAISPNNNTDESGKPLPPGDQSVTHELPAPAAHLGSPPYIPWRTGDTVNWSDDWPAYDELARRHSLSLSNRTPPPGSLAADLLNPQFLNLPPLKPRYSKSIRSSRSDFNSCNSTIESSSSSSSSEEEDSEMKSEKGKGRKRGRNNSSGKKDILKKANTQVSPKK